MWPFSLLERKENPVGAVISGWSVGKPVWTKREYDKLAYESYVLNAVAHRCVSMIATSCATVPWLLKDSSGKEIEKHPLLNLLKRPAPLVGGHALFEAFYAYQLIAGNSYLVSFGPQNKPPRELWTMRPDRTRIIAGRTGQAAAYEYEHEGYKRTFQVDPLTGKGQVFHFKSFHPTDDWYGLGKTDPAAYAIDRHNSASAHNKALLDNGARPSGALVYEPTKGASGEDMAAPKAAIDMAKEKLEENYSGAQNAGKAFVLSGNVKWQEMGITPRDMDFGNSKDDAARDICTSYGVPHILIVPGASTYNNIREAKLELWEDTILPLLDKAFDGLNAWLVPQFGEDLYLEPNLDEIPALEPRREAKRKSIIELYDKALIDNREARDALQYGDRDKNAVMLGQGDGAIIQALTAAAAKDPAMMEPLYRFLLSSGLLSPDTTFEEFMQNSEPVAQPSAADLAAAANLGRQKPPAGGSQKPTEAGGAQKDEKYSPDQPRDYHGRWTSGSAVASQLYDKYADESVTEEQLFAQEDPGAAEAAKKVEEKINKAIPTDKKYMTADGKWTPERAALHQQLLDKVFTDEAIARATPAAGEKPTMTMLGGRGGSGKSFLTSDLGPVDRSKNIIIDADWFKSQLPGYEGWNAGLFHEESSHLVDLAGKSAQSMGLNVVFDVTMKTDASAIRRVADFADRGYKIEGHYMFAAPQTAASRAIHRFYQGGKANGRYVPPKIVLANTNNERNFDRLIPTFEKWTVYDNQTTSRGEKPKLVAKGGK